MATYVQTPEGFRNKQTGEIEPFVNRVYSDDNPAPRPRIASVDEHDQALLSMADGKMYTSKAAMRESYKSSNNPQGVNYIEVGNETRNAPKLDRKSDRAGIRDAIEHAQADMSAGRIPT